MKLKMLILPLLLISALSFTGCASKKKKGPSVSEAARSGISGLEVNADSDSQKAGPLRSVNFGFNSASLSSATKSVLNANAAFLNSNSSVKVEVEGHCDERGGVQFNLALGEKRAQNVKNYLVSKGVSSRRIKTISYGKERPVAFGHDEDAWGQNRRGNFVVTAL